MKRKAGSVTTGAGWLTWLHVIAAAVAITFGNGNLAFLSRFPPVEGELLLGSKAQLMK